jgi:ornithine carbamoyltransferase
MAHSYLLGAATAGMHVRICGPAEYAPAPAVVATAVVLAARTGGSVSVSADPDESAKEADFLATDVWTSMGQEGQEQDRTAAMIPYRLDEALLARAAPGARVLHCLPAHRGEEITAEVLDGPQSLAWDQAENRLHAQKALLSWLIAEPQ